MVSHTEDLDPLINKLPEWLKVEALDEESKKRCKESWISFFAESPPKLETHRIAAVVPQVVLQIEVNSSLEDSDLYRVHIGHERQRPQVLGAFYDKRCTVNGNHVTVLECTFKVRAQDVFHET